ncbi:MAG: hypothetical protein Q8M16_21700 [Pirellulaceae bacterium]|nr:hypothetical protein [Pirellulaceae bacterium]
MVAIRTLFAAVAVGIAFLIYLRVVVPVVEGQSAERVPEIDLLGVLRVEQPGQWMSLFEAGAWQRDPNNRNIIHADGNIVMFRDYQHETDSSMRVGGLTLLLFEDGAADASQSLSEVALTADRSEAPKSPAERVPVVIEALDEAVLVFDQQKAAGLNRYGDLKQVQFLGRVKFWRAGSILEDRFVIQTRELKISGSEATTDEMVEFQFGSTNGLAKGLQITFENSGSLHSANAAITKIVGMRHMRLQQVQRLDMVPDGADKPISLSCAGPAEFSFSRLAAKFFDQVQVLDQDTGYQIFGEAILVQFQAPEPAISPTPPQEKSIFPKEMKAKDLWIYGPPATVVNEEEEFSLRSAMLHYLVDKQEFVAGPLPKTGIESWMLDAVQAPDGQPIAQDVEVVRGALSMRVPTLRYRSTSKPQDKSKDLKPEWSEGEFVATGPGHLSYRTAQGEAPVELYFQDRMTAHPDPEDPRRWLISILGQTRAKLDAQSDVNANALYLWLHRVPALDPAAGMDPTWEPDLLFAEGQVRLTGEKVRAAVREARVYFPEPRPTLPLGPTSDTLAIRTTEPPTRAMGGPTATVGYNEPLPLELATGEIRGADVTANAMIVQLDWAPAALNLTPQELAEDATAKYRVQSIDLDGNVVIEEAIWNVESGADPSRLPAYRMFGDRIVGIAAETTSTNPQRPAGTKKISPEFVWTVSAADDRQARLLTTEADLNCSEIHFDQSQHLAWANKPGTISFLIPANLKMDLASNGQVDEVPMEGMTTEAGRGSAKWTKGLQFNGRDFTLDGEVQLEIERPQTEGRVERLQAYGERLVIELTEPVKLDGSETGSRTRTARRLAIYPADKADASGSIAPVRVYHQQRTAENELLAQEVVWATGVELEPKKNTFRIAGPGSLWTMRQGSESAIPVATATVDKNELTYLKVQFQRSMEGHWSDGQVHLFGPVAALYGKASDWQVMDQESRLRQPLRITSDSMTINRWQVSPNSPPALEWEAVGRVHVLGEAFEGTAQGIKYAQAQDLLTMRGDGRAAAKFWQTSTTSTERNHLSAQKIRYRPKQEDFDFEGFQEGNLNFFSGRRGGLSGDGK